MKQYIDLINHILENGDDKGDRTGTGTLSVFGYQTRFDLSKGFPILTTKKVSLKMVVAELLWMVSGDTNIGTLHKHNCHIWDAWADANGDLGPIYGEMWRCWAAIGAKELKFIDQLTDAVELVRNNPNSRRIIVSGWNPAVLPDDELSPKENASVGRQALAPCHTLFQFYVNRGKLSCHLYQRSADAGIGIPYNTASYALLTHMVAFVTNLGVGDLIISYGDLHLYNNQIDIIKEQIKKEPLELPWLKIFNRNQDHLDAFQHDDFELIDYKNHGTVKFPDAAV